MFSNKILSVHSFSALVLYLCTPGIGIFYIGFFVKVFFGGNKFGGNFACEVHVDSVSAVKK